MSPERSGPEVATKTPPRRPALTYLLFAGAGCLLLIAAIHAAGYAAVTLAVRNSGLTPWFQNSFRALWLGYALQLAVIAAVLATAAWKPGSVSRAVTILCGLLPLPSGLLLAHYNDSLVTTVAFLLAAVLIVGGALASPVPAPVPRLDPGGPAGRQEPPGK